MVLVLELMLIPGVYLRDAHDEEHLVFVARVNGS